MRLFSHQLCRHRISPPIVVLLLRRNNKTQSFLVFSIMALLLIVYQHVFRFTPALCAHDETGHAIFLIFIPFLCHRYKMTAASCTHLDKYAFCLLSYIATENTLHPLGCRQAGTPLIMGRTCGRCLQGMFYFE